MSDKLTPDARRNREFWDRQSDEYQERHRDFIGRPEPQWGIWAIPEDALHVLGDVSGADVLELGCGAAQWSILLAGRGARMVALDNSARQLEHAREAMTAAGVEFPLGHASAEDVPLPDGAFDIVFCDHGALGWAIHCSWCLRRRAFCGPAGCSRSASRAHSPPSAGIPRPT